MSDFIPAADTRPTEAWEKTLRTVARRHDVVAVSISDAADNALPEAGLIVLRDPETGRDVAVDTGRPGLRGDFATAVQTEQIEVRRLFRRLGIDEIEVRTDTSAVRPLLEFFKRRERQLHR
jgi:uncharacterized protein (DUF58 family)